MEGDADEARAAGVLLKALEQDNPDLAEYPHAYLYWLARELAATLKSGVGALEGNFPSRVRHVCFNFPKPHNWELRTRFCSRAITAAELCAMQREAWASAQQRSEKKEGHARRLRQRTVTCHRSPLPRVDVPARSSA